LNFTNSLLAHAAAFTNPVAWLFSPPGSDLVPVPASLPAAVVVEPMNSPGPGNAGLGDYPLVVIVGPTASAKSALAVELAMRCGGEIVNFDSVQLYCGFDVGSGKPAPAQRNLVPHHMLDCLDPDQVMTAGDYARRAVDVLAALRERGRMPVLIGGSGLYLRALLAGLFEGPPRSEHLRARLKCLAERHGREYLPRMLRRLDPTSAARIQPRDTQKIIRALEVRFLARQPISAMHARGRKALVGFRAVKIGLNPPRAELYRKINARVENMFAAGLLGEAQEAHEKWGQNARKPLAPFSALGYPQALAVLRRELTLEEAIRKTQGATRQYAKRQITWFRREAEVTWFSGFGDDPEIQRRIFEWLDRILPVVVAGRTISR
jgi:tRNA dimethylallyltransferase